MSVSAETYTSIPRIKLALERFLKQLLHTPVTLSVDWKTKRLYQKAIVICTLILVLNRLACIQFNFSSINPIFTVPDNI